MESREKMSAWQRGRKLSESHRLECVGENNAMAKLTQKDVNDMRLLQSSWNFSHTHLSEIFDVSRPTVTNIVNYDTWKG